MTPYYDRNGITIYHGDCREVLPSIEYEAIDLVLTDPPFGVRDDAWDDMDAQEFARFSMSWLSAVRKVSDSLVSFYASGSVFKELCDYIYPRVRQCVWYKPPGSQYAGSSESKMWFAFEPILHCYNPASWEVVKPKFRQVADAIRNARISAGLSRGAVDMAVRGKRTGLCYRWEESACLPTDEQIKKLKSIMPLNGEFDSSMLAALSDKNDTMEKAAEKAAEKCDVFAYRTVTNGWHPCEKPVSLIGDLLVTAGVESNTILDPFVGSGTTLRAAKDLGRRAIGIEIEERYCEIAARRLEQEVFAFG